MNPERQSILESVQQVREGTQAHRHMPFAQHMTRIPMQDYYALLRLYPALDAIDPLEKTAAWEAFWKSPFAEPYLVGKVVRGVVKNGILLK